MYYYLLDFIAGGEAIEFMLKEGLRSMAREISQDLKENNNKTPKKTFARINFDLPPLILCHKQKFTQKEIISLFIENDFCKIENDNLLFNLSQKLDQMIVFLEEQGFEIINIDTILKIHIGRTEFKPLFRKEEPKKTFLKQDKKMLPEPW